MKTEVLTPQHRAKNNPACSQQPSPSALNGLLLDCTHSLASHPLSAGGVNFPLSFLSGGVGFQVHEHTTTPFPQGFKRSHKEKSTVKWQLAAVSSNGERLMNSAIKKTYIRRLNITFPNVTFKGVKGLSTLYPKQSFSKQLKQSIRNDSQTHSLESPLISTQNVLASSKYMSNMEWKRQL